jgi:predicted metal-dependent peptidase
LNSDIVQQAVIEISRDSPFYNYLFMFIERIPSSTVRTLKLRVSSSGNLQLLYNPEVLGNKDFLLVQALLKHECLHIVNGHILISVKNKRDRTLWNLCMDAAINQYIRELDVLSMPLDKLLLEGCGTDNENFFVSPPGSLPGKTAEEYHDWAIEFMKNNNTVDLEVIETSMNMPDSHEEFGDFEIPHEYIDELLKNVIAETYEKAKDGVPEGIEASISLLLNKPILDWKTIIRRFIGSSLHVGRYRTPMKPNRRYDDQPGWRNDYAAKVVIVVDTSGSIIEEEFNSFFSEIDALTRITDSRIWLVQVDEAVQSVMQYSKGVWKDLKLIGRGETDLQPAIDYAQEELRPEGIIIFTDGYTDLPVVKRKVLFVLSSKYNDTFLDDCENIYGRSSAVIVK